MKLKDPVALPGEAREYEFEIVRVVRVRARFWIEARRRAERDNPGCMVRSVTTSEGR